MSFHKNTDGEGPKDPFGADADDQRKERIKPLDSLGYAKIPAENSGPTEEKEIPPDEGGGEQRTETGLKQEDWMPWRRSPEAMNPSTMANDADKMNLTEQGQFQQNEPTAVKTEEAAPENHAKPLNNAAAYQSEQNISEQGMGANYGQGTGEPPKPSNNFAPTQSGVSGGYRPNTIDNAKGNIPVQNHTLPPAYSQAPAPKGVYGPAYSGQQNAGGAGARPPQGPRPPLPPYGGQTPPPGSVQKQKGRGGIYAFLIINLIIGLIALFLLGVVILQNASSPLSSYYYWPESSEEQETRLPPLSTPPPSGREVPPFGSRSGAYHIENQNDPTAEITEAVGPAVVGIVGKVIEETPTGKEEFLSGSGSGIVLTEDGYVITNFHVVEDTDKVYVRFEGEEDDVPAELIGYDDIRDVAVLKVVRTGLQAAVFGDSSKVKTGEKAITIGNPLGTLDGTVTQGIISASSRELDMAEGRVQVFIQTDAAINPGNSGGALVNGRGEVIGVNTLKEMTIGIDDWGLPITAEGIGYAIPINDVLDIAKLLISEGKILRPQIGVTVSTVTADVAKNEKKPAGALVETVVSKGPADEAGVKAGDIIVEIEGKKIETANDVGLILEEKRIGDTIKMVVWRNGGELTYEITLRDLSEG